MMHRAMVAAGVSAVLGAVALHLYLERFEAEAVGGPPQAMVMVARDLLRGEVITEAALTTHDLPEQYVEERHIAASDLSRVVGTRTTAAVPSGSSLLWSDLDVSQAGRTLSSLVRAGMRGFSLSAGATNFDGLLRPGDRVDVLFTSSSDGSDGASHTLLQNVLVLTVGADLGSAGKESEAEAREGNGVTLSVTQAQAERLASAEGQGRLVLVLRNPEDMLVDLQADEAAAKPSSDARDSERAHAR